MTDLSGLRKISDVGAQPTRPSAVPDGQFKGLLEAGNIDLAKRPIVRLGDGSIATVRSISTEIDGKEVLLPTVSPDGKLLTNREAIDLYLKTGQHLGKFDNPEDADAYAEALHEAQDRFYSNADERSASQSLDLSGLKKIGEVDLGGLKLIGRAPIRATDSLSENADTNMEGVQQSTGLGGDILRTLASGTASAITGLREVGHRLPVVGPISSASDATMQWATGLDIDKELKDFAARANASVTPAQKLSDKKNWVKVDPASGWPVGLGSAWSDPRSYMRIAGESAPAMLLTMGPSSIIARGVYVNALAKGLTQEVAADLAAKTALKAGMLTEGLVAGGQSAVSLRDEINAIPVETLQKSEAFQSMIKQGLTPEQARKALAEDAATKGFVLTGVTTGIFGGTGDFMLAKIIGEGVSGPILKRAISGTVKGVIGEEAEEIPQNVSQQIAENYAVQQAEPDRRLMAGVPEAFGQGVAGGLMGGPLGAVSGIASPAHSTIQQEASAPEYTINDPGGEGDGVTVTLSPDQTGIPPTMRRVDMPDGSTKVLGDKLLNPTKSAGSAAPSAPAGQGRAGPPPSARPTNSEGYPNAQDFEDFEDRERLNSPRLTPADRASPLPNDLIDDGKKVFEEALSGKPITPPNSAIVSPSEQARRRGEAEQFVGGISRRMQAEDMAARAAGTQPPAGAAPARVDGLAGIPAPNVAQSAPVATPRRLLTDQEFGVTPQAEAIAGETAGKAPEAPAPVRSDSSLNRTASWVIRNKDTGDVVMETFDKAKVDALNTAKYEAVPIQQHLASLNKPTAKEYLASVREAQNRQRQPGDAEVVDVAQMIAASKPVGINDAGEKIYDNERGRFRVRMDRIDRPGGYPDFGGDLAPAKAAKPEPVPVDVKQRAAPTRKGPLDIVEFLASIGGLKDFKSELRSLDLSKRFVPGIGKLIRESGKTLDYAREAAEEAGYITPAQANQTTTIADLLRAIEANERGQRVYSTHDTGRVQQRQAEKTLVENSEEQARRDDLAEVIDEYDLKPDEIAAVEEAMKRGEWAHEAIIDVIERRAIASESRTRKSRTQKEPAVDDIPFDTGPEDAAGEGAADASSGRERLDDGRAQGSPPSVEKPAEDQRTAGSPEGSQSESALSAEDRELLSVLPEGYRFIEGRGQLGRGKWGVASPDAPQTLIWNLHPTKAEAARVARQRLDALEANAVERELQDKWEKALAARLLAGEEPSDTAIQKLGLKPKAGFEWLSPVVQRLFGISKMRVREAMGSALKTIDTGYGSGTTHTIGDAKKALMNAAAWANAQKQGWLNSLGAAEREAALDQIKQQAAKAQRIYDDPLNRTPFGQTASGSEGARQTIKAEAIEATLRAIRKGETPDAAIETAKAEIRGVIQKHNSRSKDQHWGIDEGAYDREIAHTAGMVRDALVIAERAKAPKVEPGAEGKPQTVIPGAERISQKQQAEREASKPMRAKVPQKDAGELFDTQANAEKQGEMPFFSLQNPTDADFLRPAPHELDDVLLGAEERQARLNDLGRRIGQEMGVKFVPGTPKERAAAAEKIARKGYKSASWITDIVRMGFIINTPEQADAINQRLAQEFDVLAEGWKREPTGYLDRKSLVRFGDGSIGEVQFWEENLYRARKEGGGHKLYKRLRSLVPGSPEAEAILRDTRSLYTAALAAAPEAWSRLGGSSLPKVLNRSRQAFSSITPPDVQTSQKSTGSQRELGSSMAFASDLPSTAGRPSQFTNFMGDTSREDITPSDEFRNQAQAIGKRLRAELDRLGLKDIGLRISEQLGMMVDGTLRAADGSYFRKLISVALDAENPDAVLDHEAIHALRDVGAFGKDEWAILERQSRKKWLADHKIAEAYGDFSDDVQVEEGIAHAYAAWRAGRQTDGIVAKSFKKIAAILKAIARAFGKDFRSAEDVFAQVASGKIGNRPRTGSGSNTDPMFQAAWHGTPHDFDQFKLDKIGTGEGNQSFGWGLYFAGKKEIAEHYRNKLSSGGVVMPDGKRLPLYSNANMEEFDVALGEAIEQNNLADEKFPDAVGRLTFNRYPSEMISQAFEEADAADGKNIVQNARSWMEGQRDKAYSHLTSTYVPAADAKAVEVAWQKAINLLDQLEKAGMKSGKGSLYKVDLPEDNELMLWDAPLSEQPDSVREKIMEVVDKLDPSERKRMEKWEAPSWSDAPKGAKYEDTIKARTIYSHLSSVAGGDRAVSEALRAAGIPGHKYLDGSSRSPVSDAQLKEQLADVERRLDNAQKDQRFLPANMQEEGQAHIDALSRERDAIRRKMDKSYNYVVYDDSRISVQEKFALRRATAGAPPAQQQNRRTIKDVQAAVATRIMNAIKGGPGRNDGESIGDYSMRKMVDYLQPLRRMIETQGPVEDRVNAYQEARLALDAAVASVQDMHGKYVTPAVEALAEAGASLEDLHRYLYALHAEERNKVVGLRNEPSSDFYKAVTDLNVKGASGWSTNQARSTIQRFRNSPKFAAIDKAAKLFRQMLDENLLAQKNAGLISDETYNTLTQQWQHYVPLHAEEAVDENGDFQMPGRGRGFDVRGKEFKGATGRFTEAENIPAWAISSTERSKLRQAKNKVGKSILRFINEFDPNGTNLAEVYWSDGPGFGNITKAPTVYRRELDKSGKVVNKAVPYSTISPDMYAVKVAGRTFYVKFADAKVGQALKNMNAVQMNLLFRLSRKLTNFQSLVNTRANPAFIPTNFFRDALTGAIHLLDEGFTGRETAKILGDIPQAWAAVWRGAKGRPGNGPMDQALAEMTKVGGRLIFEQQKTVEESIKSLHRQMQAAQSGRGSPRAMWNGMVKLVEDVNDTVEMGIRLAAYSAARAKGKTAKQAAFMARDLTVDFRKHGEIGPQGNALYTFFNASVQGNFNVAKRLLGSRKVQAASAAIMLSGFALDVINRSIAGDDDDGENRYEKMLRNEPWKFERQMVIFYGPGEGSYFTIPLPYGYNAIYHTGLQMSAAAHGDVSPVEAMANSTRVLVDAFNPMGGGGGWVNMFSPTFLDPFIEIDRNRNFADIPIYPTTYPGDVTPDSQKSFKNTPDVFKWAAEQANAATGGNAIEPGAIDIHPDSIEHMWDFVSGGLGRFFGSVADPVWKASQGRSDEIEVDKLPFVRSFYGEQGDDNKRSEYYKLREDVQTAKSRLKDYKDAGDTEALQDFRDRFPVEIAAIPAFDVAEKRLRKLRAMRRRLEAGGASAERLAELDDAERKAMTAARLAYAQARQKQRQAQQ